MKGILTAVLLINSIFVTSAVAETRPSCEQDSSRLRKVLVGTWGLVKHVVTIDGKTREYQGKEAPTRYDFMQNGVFRCYYLDLSRQEVYIEGRWKVRNTGDNKISIHLFGIEDVPGDAVNMMSDYDLDILHWSANEFNVEEFLFSEESPGISTFGRLK